MSTSITNFQNTIAHGQFANDGGTMLFFLPDIIANFSFPATPIFSKNIVKTNTSDFGVVVQQDGTYFVDFSFIAVNGNSTTYTLTLYVNNTAYYSKIGGGIRLTFFQPAISQQLEVSLSSLVLLKANDIITFKVIANTLPSNTLLAKDVKINLHNLQQLGIH